MNDRSRLLNALIGAAVTIVLTFIPFSSVLGGAVAGYLEGGELGDGVRVGALSGLLATAPFLLLFFFVGSILSFGLMGMGGGRMLAAGGAFVLLVLVFSLLYLVGLSALGGAVGAAVKGNPDLDPAAD
ncbi:MAG: DUF5518 domain-containing protein [Halobacteriales archaeon]|nr:DUF5518 domain-containing protein [Halobacteriales archaeon]